MIKSEIELRVRYADTDAMGVVYHPNYLTYYEVARTEMFRKLGSTYRKMEETGVMLPIIEAKMKCFHPAHYDDLLKVKICIKDIPQVKMVFEQEIFNEQNQLVNSATITLAFMDAKTRKVCRAPEWFINLLEQEIAKSLPMP